MVTKIKEHLDGSMYCGNCRMILHNIEDSVYCPFCGYEFSNWESVMDKYWKLMNEDEVIESVERHESNC